MAVRLPLQHVFVNAPKASAPRLPGLIVLTHGTGADEHDLLDLGTELASDLDHPMAVLSLRAPLKAPFGGYRWFQGYSSDPEPIAIEKTVAESTALVIQSVAQAPQLFNTDPTKTVLVGFSQGATIGWSVAVSSWPRPDLLAAVCLMSGRLFPEYGEDGTLLTVQGSQLAEVRARRTPIWACHGRMDGVTPAAMARESVRLGREVLARGGGGGGAEEAASAEAGASSTQLPPLLYMEHAGGHEIPSKALADLSSFLQGVLAGGSGGRAAASAAGGGPDSCPP